MLKRSKKLFLLYLTAFLPAAIAGGDMPPTVVRVEDAINIEIAPFILVSGTVIARFDSKISAEVTGILKNVLDVGERLNQNQILAKIDDSKYQLAMNEISAEIKPIETMAEFFRKEVKRLEKLSEKNNAARNQLDQTQANHDEALAKIKIVKAKLAMAQDELDKTIVRAPFSGVVMERYKTPGERVEAGNQIVRLINTDKIEVQARVPQESFQHIKEGDTVLIKGVSDEIQGTVRTIIPVGDDVSRLYEIRIEFDNDNWSVGTAVQVATPVNEKQNVIAVSRDALVIRQSGIVIYRINSDNKTELIPVKTGVANTTHIQVIGNVNANDRIVTRGNERLRPGQIVQLMQNSSNR